MNIQATMTAQEAQACIDLMRQGLKVLLDGTNPDGAIAAYVSVRDALMAGRDKTEPSVKTETPPNG